MRRRTCIAVTALAVTLAAALSACSEEGKAGDTTATTSASDPTRTDRTTDQPTETSATAEPTGSSGPGTSTTASPTPTARDDSPVSRAKRSSVALEDMPGFNEQWVWEDAAGRPGEAPSGPGTSRCLRASLTAIGGVVEYSTTYTVEGNAEDAENMAVLTTAVFPDEHTARMAETVLATWLKTCRPYLLEQSGVDWARVSPARTVRTAVGPGQQQLIASGPVPGEPDAGYFNGEGYVRDGDVISYLVMHSVGQDYNYPVDEQPVALGLQAAGTALKNSR